MIHIAIEKRLLGKGGDFDLACELTIDAQAFTALWGDSGAGKSTLLRIIAGLESPDKGRIVVDDEVWFDSALKINLTPQKRRVGYLFQEYALFPNMTVEENLNFTGAEKSFIKELMDLTQIHELGSRLPHMLSGGQKQRVALARALALRPKILLLDEPLSALDQSIRNKLQDALAVLHKHFKMTTILVSHDLAEMFKLSSAIVKLEQGHITAQGTPSEILLQKQQSSKFSFMGEILFIKKEDVVYTAVINLGYTLTQVVLTHADLEELQVGDKVIIATKAFNPIVRRISKREGELS